MIKRGPRSKEIKCRISEGRKRHKFWANDELVTLKSLYPSASREETLKAFPKLKWNAIVTTANRNGLYRRGRVPHRYKFGKFPKMSEETARLAAWAISLEGTIALHRGIHSGLNPMISIGNTNFELLRQFRELTQYGHISKKPWRDNERCKGVYKWEIRSVFEAQAFLIQIIPFLPSKKEQAQLLLPYLEKRILRWKLPYDTKELDIQAEIKALNKRGVEEKDG